MTTAREDAGVWSCPGSQLILPVTASRPEWLLARRGGIGGSDLGGLMGVSPYTNPYKIWLSKRGELTDISPSARMKRGTRFEAEIANEAAELLGVTTRRIGMHRSRAFPHLFANVDRKCSDGACMEIKWVQSYAIAKKLLAWIKDQDNPDLADLFPPHWFYQDLVELAVTGATHLWHVALLPGIDDLFVRRIDALEYADQIAKIGPAVEAWWQIHMLDGVVPTEGAPFEPGDLKPGTAVEAFDPQRVLRDAARWEELKDAGAAGELEIEEIKARMKAELGDAMELHVNKVVIAKWNPRAGANKFDRKAFKLAHPELEAKFSIKGAPTGFVSLVK